MSNQVKAIRLPAGVWKPLEKLASENGTDVSETIESICIKYLKEEGLC